jgi:hypothetical protein
MQPGTDREFAEAADQVIRRLVARRWMELANRTAWPVAFGVAGLILGARLFDADRDGSGAILAVLGVTGWAAGCIGWAWRRKPDRYAAMARWDALSSDSGSLASAVCFAGRESRTAGEELHLREARRILEARRERTRAELPLGRPGRAWWAWLVVPVVWFSGWGQRAVSWAEQPLDRELRADLAALAETLATRRPDALEAAQESGSEEDAARTARLESLLEDAGKWLTSGAETAAAGEVLEGLEARAREIEALAREFHGDAAWLPEPVVEELARHADTGGLAAEIRERRPTGGAMEAEQLAEGVGIEAAALRIQHALRSALGTLPEERVEPDMPVLRHLETAEGLLSQRDLPAAATELRALGETFRTWAQKKAAREQLESLARQIRGGGNRLAEGASEGPKEAGQGPVPPVGAEELGAPPSPASAVAQGDEPAEPTETQMAQTGASPGDGAVPPPGGALPGQGMAAPVPVPGTDGTKPPPLGGSMALQAPDPNAVPVPGTEPGESVPEGGSPVPGQTGVATSGGNPGNAPGLHAGEGMAELRPNETKPLTSGRDDLVVAASGAEGRSERREVEAAGPAREAGSRGTQEVQADYAAVEEAAIDEAALPAARRDQVRRYFTALRERSAEESAEEP